ncbi:MAG: chain length-determining protein [Rhodocyclaceae bacterium]|nr:chain length-determining protein [Rhodocyclaceae bacterium]
MEEVIRQLVGYLRGMWQYRWWGLVAAWVVGIGGAIGIYLMPDRYESSARIYVDTQSVLKPLMSGLAVQPNVDQQIAILSRTLISRPNVEKLIRMADLDLAVRNDKQREELIGRLTSDLKIGGSGRDNIYKLSYMDESPEVAKRVVQSLMTIFVESGLGDKRKDTDSARRFIEEQIRSYEQKLEDAENRVKEFKLENMAYIGDGKQDYFSQLAEVTAGLSEARLALREAEQSRDSLQRQLLGEEPVLLPEAPVLSGVSIPEIDGRIDALEKNLDGLLQRFTEAHPDVIGTRRVLDQLKAERAAEVKKRREAMPERSAANVNANPVYQQMKLALSESEARVASLRARVAAHQGRLESLKAAAELVPQIEAQFTQLNRDYEIHKKNYDSLVARRESASMSVDMESTSGMAEFRVIDPPSQPLKPAAPNRILLMPAAGVLALAAGLAFAFLLSQIRPTFQDARSLREFSGLPLLGTVSMVANEQRRSRKRRGLMLFAGALTSFVGGFAVLTVLLAVLQQA